MNGVRVDYEATVKQTSKGVWYCDGVRCADSSIEGLGSKLHIVMREIEQVLLRHNPEEQPAKVNLWKKAADQIIVVKKAKQPPAKEEK